MHDWLVGGAVIEAPLFGAGGAGVLLVRNRRADGREDWTPPGGVIDAGESVLDGLTREVFEETGLTVTRWAGPIYEITTEAPDLGWRLRVEVHRAEALEGELSIGADPDGIVIGHRWAEVHECDDCLVDGHRWVREPLMSWLTAPWPGSRRFEYLLHGTGPADFSVVRVM